MLYPTVACCNTLVRLVVAAIIGCISMAGACASGAVLGAGCSTGWVISLPPNSSCIAWVSCDSLAGTVVEAAGASCLGPNFSRSPWYSFCSSGVKYCPNVPLTLTVLPFSSVAKVSGVPLDLASNSLKRARSLRS